MTQENFTFKLVSTADKSELLIDKVVVAGRSEQCELVIKQGQTSRQHSRITPADDGIWVEDLESTNGTFLNDKSVVGKVLAGHGDMVRFDTAAYNVVNNNVVNNLAETTTKESEVDPDATIFAARSPEKLSQEDEKPKRDGALPPSWALDREQAVDGTQLLGTTKSIVVPNASQFGGSVNIPTLVGKTEPYIDVHFPLRAVSDTNQWEIGRADTADIVFNHTSVSNAHAQLVNDGDRWKLVDLMSANGSYINDVKGLTTYLKSGDVIRFGQIECHFVLPKPTEADFGNATTTVAAAIPESKTPTIQIVVGVTIAVVVGVIASILF